MTVASSQVTNHFLLEACDLSKAFTHSNGPLTVIDGVNLTVKDGEILSIVGPSGCGKTTLLRLLAGLTKPDSGSVAIISERNGSGTGCQTSFVFQKPLLFPWRTVEENILLPIEIHATLSLDEARGRCAELLSSLGLSNFRKSRPNQLSGGMAQRASIARALVTEPKILFLDEPLSAVDEITRERLWLDFRQLWRERCLSVVLVTHSIREAVFLGDRVLVMSHRPGMIIGEIAVPLSKRTTDTLYQPNYIALCESVRQILARPNENKQNEV